MSPNDTREKEGVCHRSVTWHFFQNFWAMFLHFGLFLKVLRTFFCKNKNITSHGMGGGYGPMSQNDTGGRGIKNQSKSVTYYLNGPLSIQLLIETLIGFGFRLGFRFRFVFSGLLNSWVKLFHSNLVIFLDQNETSFFDSLLF